MSHQTVFKRYELKYLITGEQKSRLLDDISRYMRLDKYGHTTVRNIYFDTNSYQLIRRSIEKPTYKEKIRIRSYETAGVDSTVFVELKKKYDGVVYKRRIPLSYGEALAWLEKRIPRPADTQIAREVDYFINFYDGLFPTVFLSYEREAFYDIDGGDFRVTFDDNILCREEDVSLASPPYGTPILQPGMFLMELKCSGGIPLWMAHALSREHIYKTPFSKYGTAYERLVLPRTFLTHPKKESILNG